MNGSLSHNEKYLENFLPGCETLNFDKTFFCGLAVPFPYLFQFSNRMKDSKINLGVQDVSSESVDGPHTGDISISMLKEFDCSFSIIAHSERREKYKESNICILNKAKTLLTNNFIPIICIGESAKSREDGNTEKIIKSQLRLFIEGLDKNELSNCVFAYEPLWAIGSGNSANPSEIETIVELIRHECSRELEPQSYTKIIYGGSVDSVIAKKLFDQTSIDGALVGGASLNYKEFLEINLAALN